MPGLMVGVSVSRTGFNPAQAAIHRIVSITDSGGSRLITTAAAHGLTGTEEISVSGNSVADYNTTYNLASVPSGTTLLTNNEYTEDGTGGSWSLVS